MEHVEHLVLTGDQKRKIYWKIFYVLTALTCFELSITFAPIAKIYITLLVVIASVSKAFFVGWFYMHLNHETKGMKIVLLFPLTLSFFYAVFLIADARVTKDRHPSPYVGSPPRFFGPRNLKEPKVDDFGNLIIEPIARPQGSEHDAAHAAESTEKPTNAESHSSSGEGH
jgi:hypothetical protein